MVGEGARMEHPFALMRFQQNSGQMVRHVAANCGRRKSGTQRDGSHGGGTSKQSGLEALALGMATDRAGARHRPSPLHLLARLRLLATTIAPHGDPDLAAAGAIFRWLAGRHDKDVLAGDALSDASRWHFLEGEREVAVEHFAKATRLRIEARNQASSPPIGDVSSDPEPAPFVELADEPALSGVITSLELGPLGREVAELLENRLQLLEGRDTEHWAREGLRPGADDEFAKRTQHRGLPGLRRRLRVRVARDHAHGVGLP